MFWLHQGDLRQQSFSCLTVNGVLKQAVYLLPQIVCQQAAACQV